MAVVKKNKPAYMTATKRLLFDSDESASIVVDANSTWASEKSVIAGSRYRLLRTNVKVPANSVCVSSRHIAGAQVTSVRNRNRIASLPAMYSARVIGLDK